MDTDVIGLVAAVVGLFVLILFIAFMFRVQSLLVEISAGMQSVRRLLEESRPKGKVEAERTKERTAAEIKLHGDPDIAEYVRQTKFADIGAHKRPHA